MPLDDRGSRDLHCDGVGTPWQRLEDGTEPAVAALYLVREASRHGPSIMAAGTASSRTSGDIEHRKDAEAVDVTLVPSAQ
jgi:hypothetical protein